MGIRAIAFIFLILVFGIFLFWPRLETFYDELMDFLNLDDSDDDTNNYTE